MTALGIRDLKVRRSIRRDLRHARRWNRTVAAVSEAWREGMLARIGKTLLADERSGSMGVNATNPANSRLWS